MCKCASENLTKLSYQKPLLLSTHPPHPCLPQALRRRALPVLVLVLLSPLLLLSSVVPGALERTAISASRLLALHYQTNECGHVLFIITFSPLPLLPNLLPILPILPTVTPLPILPLSPCKVFQEARDLLQELPVGLLFDSQTISNVWIDVVERTMVFLIGVCQRLVESCIYAVREYGSDCAGRLCVSCMGECSPIKVMQIMCLLLTPLTIWLPHSLAPPIL